MAAAIITLAVGIVIVIVSFFLADGKNKGEDDALTGSREELERQLESYCSELVDRKKDELKSQGESANADMQKEFEELKESSRKELDEIKEMSKKALDEYLESVETAKKKMQDELEACEKQLSEKAKEQMIEYINKSLSEAYESYDPEDKSEKEKITYDEPVNDEPSEEKPAEAEENESAEPEDAKPAEAEENKPAEPEENVVYSEEPVTDSAFEVIESPAEKPAKEYKPRNNRSKKRKKKKPEPKKPIEIWDESVDIDAKVAELHGKGMSIMEIANALGIGVGEAKVIIDKKDEADKQ